MQYLNEEKKFEILGKFKSFVAYQCSFESPDLPFTYISEGCEALLGYSPQELELGVVCFMDMVHPEDIENVREQYESTLAIGAPAEINFKLRAKDGTERRVLSRSRVAGTNDRGMPSIVEGVLTDITKELQMETTRAANRSTSDFLSKMGYEVRTPMNAILGLAEISLQQNLPDNVREYTQTILKSGNKLMDALNNIMDFKRLEDGSFEVINESYDLASLINDLINTAKRDLGDLRLQVFIDSKIPTGLLGDSIRLHQVIKILLSNAMKFTDTGFVAFSINGETSGNTVKLTITVEDTGRGIKGEDLGKLFKEFSQFDNKVIEGTGLGLVIAYSLLKMMGGTIDIVSEPRMGTVVTVTIAQDIIDQSPICTVNEPENKKVLILEKDPIFADFISRTFKDLGVAYTIAEPSKAIDKASYTHVFSDELLNPLFCLPVANVLNDAEKDNLMGKTTYARFTVPEARVLVVDDVSANFVVASGFLQAYNMDLDFCESGPEAIKAVKLKKYDLILMDHLMPGMTGSEATQVIRSLEEGKTDCKNVPIIALTANAGYTSKELFRKSGANDFVSKPINASKLYFAIEKWIPQEMRQPIPEPLQGSIKETPLSFSIEGVNTKKGIMLTGGKIDFYLRVLRIYYKNCRKIIPELKDCEQNNNMVNYHVYSHSIAGISEGIGADEIAETARKLEEAAEKNDYEYVRANSPPFINKLEALLKNIHPLVEAVADKPIKTPPKGKKRILIIDDTDYYLTFLHEILTGEYVTMSSLDGPDGLEAAGLSLPDLIMLDLHMPGMTGYEVLAALKADESLNHIPVIIMSANAIAEDEVKALAASAYIKKPFEPKMVKETINFILGGV